MDQMKIALRLLILFLFVVGIGIAHAAQKRVALVIGNSAYATAPLKNPVNDAQDVSAHLRRLGFEVTLLRNADRRAIQENIRTFSRSITGPDNVGLFYYSGHGVEVDGQNYLIPIGADIRMQSDVEYEAVNAGRLLSGMEQAGNGLNLVILDACRNNPYKRSFRSGSRGLRRMDAPSGSLVMYAAQPGETAADGSGRNGTFTKHFLAALDQPGLKVEEVFKRTAVGVSRETGRNQLPWVEGVILGDFYFSSPSPVESRPGSGAQSAGSASLASIESEIVFWQSLQSSQSCGDYNAYLSTYPEGRFIVLARARQKRYCAEEVQKKNRETEIALQKKRDEERKRRQNREAEIARQEAEKLRIAKVDKERIRAQEAEKLREKQQMEAARKSIYGIWKGIGNDIVETNYDVVIEFVNPKILLKADYGSSRCEGVLTPYSSPEQLELGDTLKMSARLTSGACFKKAKLTIKWVSRDRITYIWTKFGIRAGSGDLTRR